MRPLRQRAHRREVRFVVELERDRSGAVHGTVTPDGRRTARFSGWLDLVRLLEDDRTNQASTEENH